MRIQAKWERATESKGDNMTVWEKLLPTFNFSFRADRADSKPSSAMQSPPICACSFFFLFSLSSEPVSCDIIIVATSTLPRPHTGDIPSAPPQHCNYCTNYNHHHVTLCGEPSTHWTCPHMHHGHTQATPPPLPSLCLVHLKKASDKSFPLFSPFVFNGAGRFPSTQACCTPCGMQAPTPPPLVCMQATPLPFPSPQPPPPQCLYDQCHFPDPITIQLASPDFATQTGGAKGALAPTISVRPPFAHPPPLCRSFHSHGCPHCALWFTCLPHPALPCPPSSPACWGA